MEIESSVVIKRLRAFFILVALYIVLVINEIFRGEGKGNAGRQQSSSG